MKTFAFEIVRPDKLIEQGQATQMVLVSASGELGVLPGHSAEICVLGDGVIRVDHTANEEGATHTEVVVKGGYAEITPTKVIVLADHAREMSDIYPETVQKTLAWAEAERAKLGEKDSRRAYYDAKIAWCELLLTHAKPSAKTR